MEKLPHWIVTDRFPAKYDLESATVIEQTAKVYGKVNELIDSYNEFVDRINSHIESFEKEQATDWGLYKTAMRQEFQDFIDTVDLKVQEVTNYMRDNLRESCKGLLDEISADAQEALTSIKSIRDNVNDALQSQNNSISNFSSILAGAIKKMDDKHAEQDGKVDEAVAYLMTNLTEVIETTVLDMLNNGQITIGIDYDSDTEEISLHARNVERATDLFIEYDEENEEVFIKEGE